MVEVKKATHADIPLIQELAEKTWWPTYSPFLDHEQIKYMLGGIYSIDGLTRAFGEGQEFILILDGNTAQGFASYSRREDEPDVYKLHKLYVLPTTHKKGYGSKMIEFIKQELLTIHIHLLDLNVNQNNPAISFYEKIGFKIIRQEDIPIGPYWMNDYVMRLTF